MLLAIITYILFFAKCKHRIYNLHLHEAVHMHENNLNVTSSARHVTA